MASAALLAAAAPAAAAPQFGQVGKVMKRVSQVWDIAHISEEDEQRVGEAVSARIRDRYGVVQDQAVHRYVTLVGTVLAQASSRPNLQWRFIVLDTDGVNAFAAPGGYVHITRGALGLIASEAELAGVLGHELTHVTEKHTMKAIQKSKGVQAVGDETLKGNSALFQRLVDKVYEMVLAGFGRDEELDSDQIGIRLANKVGYNPSGLPDFLTRLSDRNKNASAKQGLFASHPEMQERLDRIKKEIAAERLASTATLADRYKKFITYQAKPQSDIATVEAGSAGLTGGTAKAGDKGDKSKDKPDENAEQKPPEKKGRFGLGSLIKPGGSEKKSAEVTGSAASRGVDSERNAKGGPVKTPVAVTVTAADLAAFKKEGNLK